MCAQRLPIAHSHRHVHPSDRKGMLLGLNLLRLLAFNRIGEFHVELETIPFSAYLRVSA